MGIGLKKSSTAIVILSIIYISNKRARSKIRKLININEKAVTVDYDKGYTNQSLERLSKNKITWIEQIDIILKERKLEIVNQM